MIISSAYRAAFNEVFKILSKEYAEKNISCINIAPGPINTDRTKELIENIEEFIKLLPMKRLGEPDEIGNFVKLIIQNKIKYLSGVVINFDGANSICSFLKMNVPLFLHPKSKHTFSIHQHIILVLRQYESKSYMSFECCNRNCN